ncbi:MAG: hypothetical protein LC808_12400 [Actinobacteria bacterium]|nr:hypothetical protein [Actinomycetota bacterium]
MTIASAHNPGRSAVALKLQGELHDQGVIELLGRGTSTGACAANCVMCRNEVVDRGLTDLIRSTPHRTALPLDVSW